MALAPSTDRGTRPEVLAFLRDIKENPEDDVPRLILADWLEEHGDEHDAARAELIRVQCDMVRRGPADPHRAALQQRANELTSVHAPSWLGPLRQLEHARSFERGLLQLHVEARPLLDLGGGLADAELYAWVDGLRIRSGSRLVLSRLVNSGFLRGLNSLGLRRCSLRSLAVEALANSADLASLRALDISDNTIGEDGVRALVRSPHLRRLQRLNLNENNLGLGAMYELAEAAFLPALTALELSRNWMSTEAAVYLLSSGRLDGLRSLSLADNRLTDPAVVALAASPALSPPRRSSQPGSGEPGVLLPWLRRLDLHGNLLGDVSARALASSRHLSGLAWLDVSGNRMSAEGRSLLRERFGDVVQLGTEGR